MARKAFLTAAVVLVVPLSSLAQTFTAGRRRLGRGHDHGLWDVLERLTEEVLLLWADRDRDPIFDRLKDFH